MKDKQYYGGLSAGLFLIGLGLLFLLQVGIWPWILAVIGVANLPASLANKKGWYAWQGFIWLVGLAILFASGYFWPGLLILIGVSMLCGALTRQGEGSPFATPQPPAPSEAEPSETPSEPSRDTTRLEE